MTGARIVRRVVGDASALFAVVADRSTPRSSTRSTPSRSASALALFLCSLPVWLYAFGLALVRSSRGDDIAVGEPVLPAGFRAGRRCASSCSARSRVCVVVALATAWANPFAVLVPMLPLGLVGLWGARHGAFPPGAASAVMRDTAGR